MTIPQGYTLEILKASRHRPHEGTFPTPNATATEENTLCGDTLTVDLYVRNGRIKRVMYRGTGCIVSIAGAEHVAQQVENKPVNFVHSITDEHIRKWLGGGPAPARMRCANLFVRTLKQAALTI